jgi:nicotinamide mononucleotide adenylyltransferase
VDTVDTWTVTIELDEHDGHTRAVARLRSRDTEGTVGVGLARLNPADRDVPEIGAEIAAARALSELSRRLLHLAAEDVEQASGEAAPLTM